MKNLDLFEMITANDFSSVNELIMNGSNVNVNDANGFSPLSCAMKANHYAIVRLLMDNGAELNDKDLEELKQNRIREHGKPPGFDDVMTNVNAERTIADKAAKLQRHLISYYPFMIKTPRDEFFAEEFKKDESKYRDEYKRLCNERDTVTYYKFRN